MRWIQPKFGIPLILAIVQIGSNANVVEARALETRDTPLLVAPPYSVLHPLETDSGVDDTPKTRKTSSTTVQHSTTSTSTASTTKAKSGPKSTSSASTTTATSSATSAAATSASAAPTTEADKQPSSIKYLVPVFALILITLIGWGYSRWYSRRKQQRQDDDAYANRSQPKGPTGQGWKEVKPTEGDYDEKDEWYDGDDDHPEDWENQYVVTETVRTVRSTWGWKETLNAWRSARGKENEQDQLEAGEMGERKTMKLVNVLNKGSSYQTLPDLDGRPLYEDSREDIMEEEVEQVEQVQRTEERGSIRALRDKLASLSYGGLLGVKGDKGDNTGLDRNRSPNKRKIRIKEPLPNVDPPEWIQPGVLSPSATQMLSPPLHPHLFFHPAPSSQSIQGTLPSVAGDDSSQTIRAKATSAPHARFPTIPSSATALAAQESYTAIPKMSPRTVRSRSQIESPDPKSSPAKRSATLPPAARPPPRTPKRSNTSASASSNASKTTSATPATIKRSTATTSVPDTTQSKFNATPSRRSTKEKSTPSSTAMAPRKSRQQRKVDQAQNQVEDILKASWSDRAILSSPLSVQSIDGLVARTGPSAGVSSSNVAQVPASGVGSTSPGVESAAVMGGMGGGIEQRLAMLNNVKL